MIEIDKKWLLSLCNVGDVLCGWTERKATVWVMYLLTVTLLVFLQFSYDWTGSLVEYVKMNLLPIAIAILSVEPMLMISIMCFVHYPGKLNAVRDSQPSPQQIEYHRRVAIVIPCHKSEDVVKATVTACLKHVGPEQIFIVDNATAASPLDNTKGVLDEECPRGINYLWNPYGNKTCAQYAGVVAAEGYDYILIIDDDVILPENMQFNLDQMSNRVKALCYPIRAKHPEENQTSLFIEWQSLEYKMSDFAKLLQSKWSTVLFPHGAAPLWERNMLLEILRWHDTVFYADDVKMGIYLQNHRYQMKLDTNVLLDTLAPASFGGPAPNLYCQRVRSWDMAEHVYFSQFAMSLFTTQFDTIVGTIVMKCFQLYSLYSIISDWIRIPTLVIALCFSSVQLATIMGGVLTGNTVLLLFWNLVGYRQRPSMRSSWFVVLTFQWYRVLMAVTRFLGFLRALTIYVPNFGRKPTIPQLEKRTFDLFKATTSSPPVAVTKGKRLRRKSSLVAPIMVAVTPERIPVWLSDDERFAKYKQSIAKEFIFDNKRYTLGPRSNTQLHLSPEPSVPRSPKRASVSVMQSTGFSITPGVH